MKTLKKQINLQEVGKAFKNIRQTRSGAIIVERFDRSQDEKLKKAASTMTNITAKKTSIQILPSR